MRHIDADEAKKRILRVRDSIPLTVPPAPYEFGPQPNRSGQLLRGGLRYALRCIEECETIVERGVWIDNADPLDTRFGRHDYRCSVCDAKPDYFIGGSEDWWCTKLPSYCPSCGAKNK